MPVGFSRGYVAGITRYGYVKVVTEVAEARSTALTVNLPSSTRVRV